MTDTRIAQVTAREILDSRGHPTIEVDITLASGALGSAAVPSGASTGLREAVELRDGDAKRFRGKGMQRAIANVEREIGPALKDLAADDQRSIDRRLCELDGTPKKSRLGANAMLGVSMAVARAAAAAAGETLYRYLGGPDACVLPMPMLNVINGGRHAPNHLDFQEFMIVPIGALSFAEGLRMATEVYHALRDRLAGQGLATAVGDEGGFAPDLHSHEEALSLLVEAIERAGYEPGRDVALALDPAASELHGAGGYGLEGIARSGLSARDMIELYREAASRFPIVSIEDGLGEEDWQGWRELTRELGSRLQIVGDDVFVTDPAVIERAIADRVANAALIKLNQIGTVTETLDAMRVARGAGYGVVVSHRSGETEDTFIADFAVATGAGQIKTGAPCRGERTAKYNRLLRIEAELGRRGQLGRLPKR